MLKETSKKYEQTIIMITHNRGIAQTADRVLQVSVFDRIMGNTKYGLIGIQLDSNATEETIAEIRSLENDDIIITDQRESNKQNNATYLAVRIVCYGFLAIVGIISLFNIVNSISMSVSARMKQYGAMRAVGMDNRQLKRMISAEAYTYAISGLIVGCGIGLPLSRFLYNRLIAIILELSGVFLSYDLESLLPLSSYLLLYLSMPLQSAYVIWKLPKQSMNGNSH